MKSLATSVFLLSSLASLAAGQSLSSIPLKGSSTTTTSTAKTSSTVSSVYSSTSLSFKPSSSASTTSQVTRTGYDLAVTTTFIQPTDCSGRVTQLATATQWLWQNVIDPVPGTYLTSCYPSQFYSSALATASLPPFQQLICPSKWETYQYNATYIVCCPNGFGLTAMNTANVQRPAADALCTSLVRQDVLLDVTSYDSLGTPTVVPTTVGTDGILVLATPFDGKPASITTVSSSSQNGGSSTKSGSISSISTTTKSTTSSSGLISSVPSTSRSSTIATPIVSTTASVTPHTTTPTTTKSTTKPTATTSAQPTMTLTPDNTCGNIGGGNSKGYTCDPSLAQGGPCCSSSGYCGKSGKYCGVGCQAGFGKCGTLTPDNSCGNVNGGNNKGYFCNPSLAQGGTCCSANGYCGNSTSYCGTGCQPGFGTCT